MAGTVLIIDDSSTELKEIRDLLLTSGIFERSLEAHDGIEGFKLLLKEDVELIICDLIMPNMDGFKFLEMMATQEELRNIPVIMLTALEEAKMKVRGLEHGACDYVTKPYDNEELIARVKLQMKLKRQQDELKHTNMILAELTTRDPLTQLHNRRAMMDILEREQQRANRKKNVLSIVMIDIDHFKMVNDEYGHQSGDKVLIAVSEVTRNRLRGYDYVARYGGEEFVLILPDTPLDGAVLVAERLRARIEKMDFDGALENLRVTVSMGVATYPAPDITSIENLIRAADAALYKAKKKGRNRVESVEQKASAHT